MFVPIVDNIEIDREKRVVRVESNTVHLTGLEFGLFDYLVTHANRICPREEVIDHVWGARFHYDTGTLDVHLNALRRKLGFTKNAPIETIRGVGIVLRTRPKTERYTIDLQTFASEWLRSHEAEISSHGLVASMQLTPFVNEITMDPEALHKMLDAVLQALLPVAGPGVLRLSSKLTMQHFTLSLDINGTVNELRIPTI